MKYENHMIKYLFWNTYIKNQIENNTGQET